MKTEERSTGDESSSSDSDSSEEVMDLPVV